MIWALAIAAAGLGQGEATASAAPAAEVSTTPVDLNIEVQFFGRLIEGSTSEEESWAQQRAGRAQWLIAHSWLEERNARLSELQEHLDEVTDAVDSTQGVKTPVEKARLRDRLRALAAALQTTAAPLIEQAVALQAKYTKMMRKAVAVAADRGQPIPGADPEEIKRRAASLASGEITRGLGDHVAAVQNTALGLAHFLDDDTLGAIEKLRLAERQAPHIAVVHIYLGSFYYLVHQPRRAEEQWRRALELRRDDPMLTSLLRSISGTP